MRRSRTGARPPSPRSSASRPPSSEARAIQDHLVKLGVEMQLPGWNGRGTIRLSAHVYNQPSDYKRLALGVREVLTA
jgi:selenocysteine lyase/cysteine desulfurase